MKTLFKKISKVIDFLSKNISRLKTIGTILLVFVFILSLGNGGCQRRKAIDLAKQLTGLDFKNSILKKSITQKDIELVLSNIEKDSLNSVIAGLKDTVKVLEDSEKVVRANLRGLRDSLMNIPSDSSYAYLQTQAYPYPGKLKYPFNEPQVRNIHLDYLENKGLWVLNENLMSQVDNCKETLVVKDEIMFKYGSDVINLLSQKGEYEEFIDNKDKEIELLTEDADKEKRKKGFWKITSAVLAVLIVLIAL